MAVSPDALKTLVRRWRFDFANHCFAKEPAEKQDVQQDCQRLCDNDAALTAAYERFRANHNPAHPPRWVAFTRLLMTMLDDRLAKPDADKQAAELSTKEGEWHTDRAYRQTEEGKREHNTMFRRIYEKAGFPVPRHLLEEVGDVPEDQIPF